MRKYTLTHTGAQLDKAVDIVVNDHDANLLAYDLLIVDTSDPSTFAITSGGVDSVQDAFIG